MKILAFVIDPVSRDSSLCNLKKGDRRTIWGTAGFHSERVRYSAPQAQKGATVPYATRPARRLKMMAQNVPQCAVRCNSLIQNVSIPRHGGIASRFLACY